MRVRLVLEYDTEETLEYERAAWLNEEVTIADFLALIDEQLDGVRFKITEVTSE